MVKNKLKNITAAPEFWCGSLIPNKRTNNVWTVFFAALDSMAQELDSKNFDSCAYAKLRDFQAEKLLCDYVF